MPSWDDEVQGGDDVPRDRDNTTLRDGDEAEEPWGCRSIDTPDDEARHLREEHGIGNVAVAGRSSEVGDGDVAGEDGVGVPLAGLGVWVVVVVAVVAVVVCDSSD